ASLLQAALSLTLPHTPPKKAGAGVERFAFVGAMQLLKKPFVAVLFLVTFLDATVHQGYFIWTGTFLQSVGVQANWVMPIMSIGQVAEIGTMAFLGAVLARLGWRPTMVIGLFPVTSLVIAINLLHGIAYAFFFATVYIFVDEFFPKDARSAAQGLFNFLILGVGPFVAGIIWPQLEGAFKSGDAVDYQKLFLIP